CQQYKIAPWTF
nr:immunoglobulin light chain junction region [Macaca mulatta]